MKREEREKYMVSSRSLILLLLLGICSQFSLNAVVGQDANTGGASTAKISAGSLEIELSTLQEKLRRRSLEELERRKAQLNRLDQLRYESRNQERLNNAIQKTLSELDQKISESDAKTSLAVNESMEIQTQENRLKERVVGFLQSLKNRISNGIPWKKSERVASVETSLQLIRNEDTSAQAAIAAAGRMVKEQEALGRLVEFGIIEVEVDGETRGIEGFHFGLLGVVFSDAEGNVFGWAGPGQSIESGISKDSSDSATGYLMAVDILNRKRTPGLVNIQVPSLQVKGDQ